MIAKWFRFLDDDGAPTGHVGLAVSATLRGVFWQIDEFGDPYRAEVMTAIHGGFCLRTPVLEEDEFTEHEASETLPGVFLDYGWKVPVWCKDPKWSSV